jgi:hypothetical protein
MGPFMNFGAMPLRQAAPGLMQGSLGAAQVAPNKLSLWDKLRKNPQMLGMGMQMMQAGQRQPMGQAMNLGASLAPPQQAMSLLQGILQRRG